LGRGAFFFPGGGGGLGFSYDPIRKMYFESFREIEFHATDIEGEKAKEFQPTAQGENGGSSRRLRRESLKPHHQAASSPRPMADVQAQA